MDVKIARLPAGKDPADLVKENPDLWKKAIREATHIIDCLIDQVDAKKLDARSQAIEIHKVIIPYVNKLESAIEQAHFIEKISRKFGISQDVLWRDVSEVKTNNVNSQKTIEVKQKIEDNKSINDQLLGILLWQKSQATPDIDVLKLENQIKEIMGEDAVSLADRNPDIESIIFTTESIYSDKKILINTIKELLIRLKRISFETRRSEIKRELEVSENSTNSISHDDLLKELQEISKNIESLHIDSIDIN
jgi:DNA primase